MRRIRRPGSRPWARACAWSRAGLAFGQLDVFLNVVGGVRIVETAGDLAVAASLASSVADRPLPGDAVFVGEVGLGGELRSVSQVERRLAEAARMGFHAAYLPARAVPARPPEILLAPVADVAGLVGALLR